MIIINPGTEARRGATEANAEVVAATILQDLELEVSAEVSRCAGRDADGWFGFLFRLDDKTVVVDIPGDDPETVCEGRPFKSRRLYVEGSSWLYGYALNHISEGLGLEEGQ